MFDFFDSNQNPFMAMMQMDQTPPQEETPQTDGAPGMEAMQLMQQMFQMQMQFAQYMFMMPFCLMQGAAGLMGQGVDKAADTDGGAAAPQAGFQIGGLTIPPELLQKLLQMDMTPENLQKLQGVLDFVFSAMPEAKKEQAD